MADDPSRVSQVHPRRPAYLTNGIAGRSGWLYRHRYLKAKAIVRLLSHAAFATQRG